MDGRARVRAKKKSLPLGVLTRGKDFSGAASRPAGLAGSGRDGSGWSSPRQVFCSPRDPLGSGLRSSAKNVVGGAYAVASSDEAALTSTLTPGPMVAVSTTFLIYVPLADAGLALTTACISAAKLSYSCFSENPTLPMGTCRLPVLSTRNSTRPPLDSLMTRG